MRLLIATHNRGKRDEFAALLAALGAEVVTLDDLGITLEVEENGNSYAENAVLKARGYAAAAGCITLADDSGLEVDALGGEPGYMSARYAGENASDKDRVAYLLSKLQDVPQEKRTARFRCVVALMYPPAPGGRPGMAEVPAGEVVFTGTCEGMITFAPRGSKGFGYDPLFYVPEYGCTMGELNEEVKNRISHRARALAKALPVLAEIFGLRL